MPLFMWPALQQFDKIAWFGIFLLPFILKIDRSKKGDWRYLAAAFIFSSLYIVLGQEYWAMAAGLSIIFSLIEIKFGRLNEMAFYALIFYLPITRSFFMLFGFYIRLEITKWAAGLISLFDQSVGFASTIVTHNGAQFSVDAGCMGLRLVITGFLLTLLIVNQRSFQLRISVRKGIVSLFLSLSFVLIIIANFFRIVLLILIQSPEGTISHEAVGLATMVMFHTIPIIYLSKLILSKPWAKALPDKISYHKEQFLLYPSIALIALTTLLSTHVNAEKIGLNEQSNIPEFAGFESTKAQDGVISFSNGKAKFTIKPLNPLSFSNHHPMICWRGDGFEISNESLGNISEFACMKATLKSETHQSLNTVWWYTNGDGFET
ncbi:MAG: exosortase N, partial [Salibacteraceae bacterium]|nr:exosortase N [Salibacteraceae bacterium]